MLSDPPLGKRTPAGRGSCATYKLLRGTAMRPASRLLLPRQGAFFDKGWGNRPGRLPLEVLGAALQAMEKRGPRLGGLKHRKERSMDYFAGLDVSVKETSVCIVDGDGRIALEAKVASEPEALAALLRDWPLKRIGLEAGALSQWLWSALAGAGLPAICVETRQMHAMLKAHTTLNKTDRNDARGIAQI